MDTWAHGHVGTWAHGDIGAWTCACAGQEGRREGEKGFGAAHQEACRGPGVHGQANGGHCVHAGADAAAAGGVTMWR
eukprot:358216-Chlamydomonas_euryale.AAC.2